MFPMRLGHVALKCHCKHELERRGKNHGFGIRAATLAYLEPQQLVKAHPAYPHTHSVGHLKNADPKLAGDPDIVFYNSNMLFVQDLDMLSCW